MTPHARGEVLFAPFLYSDGEGIKPRPVCVVSVPAFNVGGDVLVAMVTSSAVRRERPGVGDVVLQDWEGAGLWRPSVVRTGRLFALEVRLVERAVGQLSPRDLTAIDRGLSEVLGLT